MKKQSLSLLLTFLCLGAFAQRNARVAPSQNVQELRQKLTSSKSIQQRLADQDFKYEPVVCPANHTDVNTFVDFSDEVKVALKNKRNLRGTKATKKAQFNVEYVNFPPDAEASFQLAVDIWSELLDSEVPINVIALWQPLGPNVLGSASPTEWRVNFPGAPKSQTYYPISLAEKISRRQLNAPDSYDLVARFSSDQNWYLGSTGTPAVGQFDLTTVVLHELCHGLGFFASYGVNGSQGFYGIFNNDDRPAVMDHYFENDSQESLLDTALFAMPSTQLRNELISENLFFNGPKTIAAFNEEKPRMYAPTIFDQGSSISHLDDGDFPSGTENSLMTPSAGFREVSRDPGPIVISMFEDMGYKSSALVHDAYLDFEDVSSLPFTVDFFSDTTVVAESVKLHMREIPNSAELTNADFEIPDIIAKAVEIPLTRIDGTNKFSVDYTLDVGGNSYVIYWFSGVDARGDTLVSPAGAPAPGSFYFFTTGFEDIFGPQLFYFPPEIIGTFNPVSFSIFAEDDYDSPLQSVAVRYSIDGGPEQTVEIPKYDINRDSTFLSRGATLDEIFYYKEEVIPTLELNQRVRYQIVATDAAGQTTIIPTTAGGVLQSDPVIETEYELVATNVGESVTEYFTDFEDPTEDFALLGFEIEQPEGLNNKALRTRSPYSNGLGLYNPTTYQVQGVEPRVLLDFEANQVALFRRPITIKADTAIISWDEIVLVEPGEDGQEFGDAQFWDYVIFEYSADGGATWDNLEPGYDSGSDSDWNDIFVANIGPANAENYTSNALPTAALFRTQEIDLYEFFIPEAAGAEILIRFRMFADQWANGFGWVIDNLAIQRPQEAALSVQESTSAFVIGPNPTTDVINIRLNDLEGESATMEVIDIKGTKTITEKASLFNGTLEHTLTVGHLNAGTYMLKVSDGVQSKFKKFSVQ